MQTLSFTSKPRLCVDFDGTIFDGKQVYPGCVQVLCALRERFTIAIFSARGTEVERLQMVNLLLEFGVPYDELLPQKPEADFYLDDKGRQFIGWDMVLEQLT